MRGKANPGEKSSNSDKEGRSRPHLSLGQVPIVWKRNPPPPKKKRTIQNALDLNTLKQPSRLGEEYKK